MVNWESLIETATGFPQIPVDNLKRVLKMLNENGIVCGKEFGR